MKKSIISMVLTVSLLFLLITPTFANPSPYDVLKKKGFSAEYLDSLSTDMHYSLLQKIGDNDVYNIVVEEMFLVESPKTNEVNPLKTDLSQNILYVNLQADGICQQGTNRINQVLVTITWEWLQGKPSFRLTDAITVNWKSDVLYLSENGFLSRDKYRMYGSSGDWTYNKIYENPAQSNQGGIGYYTRLASDANFNMQPGGETIIMLKPCEPMYKGDTNGTSINFNYTHNKNLIIPIPTFSKTGISVSVTSLIFYDETSRTREIKYSK